MAVRGCGCSSTQCQVIIGLHHGHILWILRGAIKDVIVIHLIAYFQPEEYALQKHILRKVHDF